MELGQLRALREVQLRGSIAAAAQALHVTPSSVSQQLAALQRKANTPLTRKQGRRTVLTPAGVALAAAAVDVEIALAKAQSAVDEFAESSSNPVSVAAFNSAGMAYFGPLEHALKGIDLRFVDADVEQHAFPELTQDFDVVIAHRLPGSAPWPNTVTATKLIFEPLDIAVSTSHELAACEQLLASDLVGQRWISVHSGFALAGVIEFLGTLAGKEATIVHTINEFFIAASLVAAGNCISFMPRYTVAREQFPQLKLIPLREPQLGRNIDVLTRPEARERASVRAVIAALKQQTTLLEAAALQNGAAAKSD